MKYNSFVVNTQTKREAKALHNNNQFWRNYAYRLAKNPYVKKYLYEKYNGVCQYCGLPLNENFVLQHKVYDRECITDEYISVSHPTPKSPNGNRKTTKCEICPMIHECVDGNIFPVHSMCNKLIAETHQKKEIL